jgi:hypothetical protein
MSSNEQLSLFFVSWDGYFHFRITFQIDWKMTVGERDAEGQLPPPYEHVTRGDEAGERGFINLLALDTIVLSLIASMAVGVGVGVAMALLFLKSYGEKNITPMEGQLKSQLWQIR